MASGLTAEFEDLSLDDIAPNGDIVFLVGPDKKRIRAYSNVMINTSAVFAAMLGPNFSEGQKLIMASEGQPAEVKLPDDDYEPFTWVVKAVHCKAMERPDSSTLLGIAKLADKYDFNRALTYAAGEWVINFCDSTSSLDIWKALIAAYILNSSRGFKSLSEQLLRVHEGSFWELTEKSPDFDASFKLACELMIKRQIFSG